MGRGTFDGTVSVHCNVPTTDKCAQHTWQMNAFTATRGDKTAMRSLARLLWTFVVVTTLAFTSYASYLRPLSFPPLSRLLCN